MWGPGWGRGGSTCSVGERTKFQDLSILGMFLSVGSLLISGPWESFIEHSDLSPSCSQRQWEKGKGQETIRPLLACLFWGCGGGSMFGSRQFIALVGRRPKPAACTCFPSSFPDASEISRSSRAAWVLSFVSLLSSSSWVLHFLPQAAVQ